MPRGTLILCCLFLFSLGQGSAFAASASGWPKTKEEFARLPAYCAAKLGQTDPQTEDAWSEKLGSCWTHVHRYCWGLNVLIQVAGIPDKAGRTGALNHVLREGTGYMQAHTPKSCVLMPEVLVNQGQAYVMLRKPQEALKSYREAIDLNQRYIPAYIEMAKLYGHTGQGDVAKSILEYALQIDPDNKAVQRRLGDLTNEARSDRNRAKAIAAPAATESPAEPASPPPTPGAAPASAPATATPAPKGKATATNSPAPVSPPPAAPAAAPPAAQPATPTKPGAGNAAAKGGLKK